MTAFSGERSNGAPWPDGSDMRDWAKDKGDDPTHKKAKDTLGEAGTKESVHVDVSQLPNEVNESSE